MRFHPARMPSLLLLAVVFGAALCLASAPVAAEQRTVDVNVGDRVEFERVPGKMFRGTVTRIDQGAAPAVAAFTVIQDHDNDRYSLLVQGSKVRKLDGSGPAAHTAPPARARAACPQVAARQGATASPELVRSLIVCMLEDNTGVYAGKTVNVDVRAFEMGRTLKNRDAPVSLRYAGPNATLYNAVMRYNQRIYGYSDVVHFDGAEYNFTVYVDLHNRWAVGSSRIKTGEMRRTALPR